MTVSSILGQCAYFPFCEINCQNICNQSSSGGAACPGPGAAGQRLRECMCWTYKERFKAKARWLETGPEGSENEGNDDDERTGIDPDADGDKTEEGMSDSVGHR